MTEIVLLTDYQNRFGSKHYSEIEKADIGLPGGGMDLKKLAEEFLKYSITVKYLTFIDIDLLKEWKGKIVLYTSSEDKNGLYKSYIEDIIFGLELAGAIVIPKFKYLRAHNNKVFMEILRSEILGKSSGINSLCFGNIEELNQYIKTRVIKYPCVIKSSAGAMSRGVAKAESESDLLRIARNISNSFSLKYDLREIARKYKYRNYLRLSSHRNKFIVQPLIEGLKFDWKVLFYGDHIYNLKRLVRKNDFRASGSGFFESMGYKSGLTSEMLFFLKEVYYKLDLPFASLDFAFDGEIFYILEFQALYFGTKTLAFSNDYYVLESNDWKVKQKNQSIEEEYVYGIMHYLKRHKLLVHDI